MSKKKVKLTAEQKSERLELKKKKRRIKAVIIAAITAAVIACAVVSAVIISSRIDRADQLYNVKWVPVSAKNASDDEVDVNEIYNVYYSNYQGHLTFEKDGSFSLWINPGDPDDGTHGGTFELKDDKIIADFDEGTETEFELERGEDGYIKTIKMGYEDYTVYFGASSEPK